MSRYSTTSGSGEDDDTSDDDDEDFDSTETSSFTGMNEISQNILELSHKFFHSLSRHG
jgi:hypothetical protein